MPANLMICEFKTIMEFYCLAGYLVSYLSDFILQSDRLIHEMRKLSSTPLQLSRNSNDLPTSLHFHAKTAPEIPSASPPNPGNMIKSDTQNHK